MAEKYTLEQLQQMGFVPDPPPAAPPSPTVGAAETFALRGSQALPAGGLISDLLSTGVVLALRPKPGAVIPEAAKQELASMGVEVEEPEGAVDAYRDIRDTRRLRTAAGSQQNPNAARFGTGVGIAASIAAPLPKTSLGAVRGANGTVQMGRAARVGNAALTGGLYGAFNGATDGPADLTRGDVGGALEDTASGAGWGTALGGAAGVAAEGVRPIAGALRRFAVRKTKQAVQGGSDIATAARKKMTDEAAEATLENGGLRAFDTTEEIYNRLRVLAQERGKVYGDILRELEERGVRGPDIERMAEELYSRHLAARAVSGADDASARVFADEADNLRRIARDGPYTPSLDRLPLTQTEGLKRSLQRAGKYDRLRNTGTEESRQEVASVVRQGIDDTVAEAGATSTDPRVRELAGQFGPVKEQLGNLLEARRFGELGATKAAGRSDVGLIPTMMGLGTSGGNPAVAAANAAAFSFARNRLPSTLAAGSFNLSEGLRTGSLSSEAAAALGGAAELGAEEAQSRADRATIDPDTDPITAALIRALRTKPKKDSPKKEAR